MNKKNVVKGAPSGFVISLMVHAAAFLLAGMLVVFTVHQKEEKKFVPPKPVDRPKMKLKKPTVKVKKSAKPKSTTRIVTKIKRANMPDIQLPEMSGMGDSLGGGIGGFDILPNLTEMASPFGAAASIGSDLEGTFIDFNRTRRGTVTGIESEGYIAELVRFHMSGWREATLSKYYRSPKKLYSTTVSMPPLMSPLGPAAFDEPDNKAVFWIVLYKGQLVYHEDIKFRFVGNSDNVLAVRVGGKVVLDASREDRKYTPPLIDTSWLPDSADYRKWYHCHDYSAVGNLVELKAGEPQDIQIIIGESGGVLFNANLWVKVEGVDYPRGQNGSPILPIFQTAELTRAQKNMIYRGMPEDQVSFSGPVFNDYAAPSPEPEPSLASSEPEQGSDGATQTNEMDPKDTSEGMRTWMSKDGKSFEAQLATLMGRTAVLKTPKGKQVKFSIEEFSEEDQRYLSLSHPPELVLDLSKSSDQRIFKHDDNGQVGCLEYVFSPKIKVKSKGYNHPLRVDYWVIGSEIGGSANFLLDKGSQTFNPSELEGDTFTFSGQTVLMYDWVLEHIYQQRRGERYEGFLINVIDERGKIIAQRSSPTWLAKNLDRLKEFELGQYFDDSCTEIWPTPLKVPAN